jgi:cation transport regulator ChaB
MPYASIDDPPPWFARTCRRMRRRLIAAPFNNAWNEYDDEATAHRVA